MASEYFATVQVEDVDIVKFLNAACAPGLVDVNAYQKAIDSYIKSLNSLVDDENLPKSARDHAASLMDRYRTVCPTPPLFVLSLKCGCPFSQQAGKQSL
jgi:hypothetical protein